MYSKVRRAMDYRDRMAADTVEAAAVERTVNLARHIGHHVIRIME